MPRVLPVLGAMSLLLLGDWAIDDFTQPDANDLGGLAGILAVPALLALRWSARRESAVRPLESRPILRDLIAPALFAVWLYLFHGRGLASGRWGEFLLLLPFVWIDHCMQWGLGRLLGLTSSASRRFALARTRGLLPALAVLAALHLAEGLIATGGVESPLGQMLLASALLVACASFIVLFTPLLTGARTPQDPQWQACVDAAWPVERGRAPQVRLWDSEDLLPQALAYGFWRGGTITLTDALLSRLRHEEVRAVLLHEVAHLRRRHGRSLMAGALSGVFAMVLWESHYADETVPLLGWMLLVMGVVSVALIVTAASRQFEMQADMDAASASEESATALASALARLSPLRRPWSLRHFGVEMRRTELLRQAAGEGRAQYWNGVAHNWRRGLETLPWLFLVAAAILGHQPA